MTTKLTGIADWLRSIENIPAQAAELERLQCRYARLHAAAEKMANGLCYDNLSELRGVLNELKREELSE